MIKKVVIRGFRTFRDFTVEFRDGMNVLVGANEAGKSTLLEAITMALTGHVGGRWVGEELNPYWFNTHDVEQFFTSQSVNTPSGRPEILIEVFLESSDPHVQKLAGKINSLGENVPGLRVRISPSADYALELKTYLEEAGRPKIIPTDYYEIEWTTFSGATVGRAPRGVAITVIDSRTVRSTAGLDFHTRQLLQDHLDERTGVGISVALRKAREDITKSKLSHICADVDEVGTVLHDREIRLRLDQSSNAAWQHAVVPAVDGIPFAMAGEGQQASIKVALAMAQSREKSQCVLVEEPENHLAHTRLTKLIARIEELAADRQVIITTHSSYVLNRLGLDRLILLAGGKAVTFSDLDSETVKYFKRLSGYDTLRVVLADRVALVEGPADEIVFQRAYRDATGKSPMDDGVDVIAVHGLAFKRALGLAKLLDRPLAMIRDNDGESVELWQEAYSEWIDDDQRRLFIGEPADGKTLEPQVVRHNGLEAVNDLISRDEPDVPALLHWMQQNKTEAALAILESNSPFLPPAYIRDAVIFLSAGKA